MDVKGIGGDKLENDVEVDLRRGPWTVDEDLTLINYIATHGEGRWNSLARSAGLKRTGKSCRLRWLNYLRPDVRRGNISLEEQLLILELHSRWGNRWSKIAQYLPGRTDNEIKNYWRTRVQKHAKQLKCDVNSKQFKDTMRYLWMPRLVERIQAAAAAASSAAAPEDSQTLSVTTTANTPYNNDFFNTTSNMEQQVENINGSIMLTSTLINNPDHHSTTNYTYTPDPDNTSTPASSDSFGTHLSPLSQFTPPYNYNNPISPTPHHHSYYQPSSLLPTPPSPSFHFSQPIQPADDTFDNFWNLDNFLFLHQHLNTDPII